jgi:hypothetical protein
MAKNTRARPWTCSFEYVDKEGITRVGKGRTFDIEGKQVDLFPSGVLCDMLGRSQKTLYQWEHEYNFPVALYYLNEDSSKKRWYSRNQLMAIRHVYEHCGRLAGPNRGRFHAFVEGVRAVFYVVDRIEVRTKETTNERR